jgi:hypothetical protein
MDQTMFGQFHSVLARLRQRAGPAELQKPETQIVYSLRETAYLRFGDSEPSAANLRCQKMPESAQSIPDTSVKAILELNNALRQHVFRLDHNFRCGAGRGSTQI